MRRAKGTGFPAATALSLAVHALLMTALWLHAPRLMRPHEDAGPPEPIIPILLLPYTPPAAPGAQEKPAPIRLHRRQLHPDREPPAEVQPLVAREAPPAAPPPAQTTAPIEPRITVQPSPARQLATVLRRSAIGCANPQMLNREEREACFARLGRGAAQAPYLPPAMSRETQSALDAAVVSRDRAIRQREGSIPAGPASPSSGAGASNRNRPLYTPAPSPSRP